MTKNKDRLKSQRESNFSYISTDSRYKNARTSNFSRDSYFASGSSPSSPLELPSLFTANSDFNQFPCSSSFIGILILILRYKDTSEKLIKLIITEPLAEQSSNFFLHRLKIYNILYQVYFLD